MDLPRSNYLQYQKVILYNCCLTVDIKAWYTLNDFMFLIQNLFQNIHHIDHISAILT